MEQEKESSLEKWRQDARPMKPAVFGSWVACVVLTTIIGFVSGGWVTDRASRKLDKDMADDAKRLALTVSPSSTKTRRKPQSSKP
jgi:hypothetical protein